MLTRRELLNELSRIGVKEPFLLKTYFKDFEHYIEINYGLKIGKTKVKLRDVVDLGSPSSRRQNLIDMEFRAGRGMFPFFN